MNTKFSCEGDVEKLLKKHRKEFFPHLKTWESYMVEMARQRAEEDFKKKQGES